MGYSQSSVQSPVILQKKLARAISAICGAESIGYINKQTGGFARTVFDKLTDSHNIKDYGNISTKAGFSGALRAAITAAAGSPVIIPRGVYEYDEGGITDNIVNLVGEAMPVVNPTASGLEPTSGTIIKGKLNCSGDYVYIMNLGVDRGSASFVSGDDAIKASANPYNSGRICVLENVVGLGRNDNDAYHGVLIEGYANAFITNVIGGKNQFCGAIKSRNVVLNGFHGIGGQNTLILKSDTGGAAGSLSYIKASGITGAGTANTSHGLRILADNAPIESVNIDGVNIRDSDRCVTVEAGVALSDLNISNVNGKRIRLFGVVTSGDIYEVNLTNFNLVELGSRAAQLLSGRKINVQNFFGSMDNGATTQAGDFFRVESGVSGFTGHNIELNENYGVGGTVGTLLLQNSRSQNMLSSIKANINGNIPLYGFNSQSVSGATATVTPLFNLDTMSSLVKVSASANTTITTITTTLPGGASVPEGYRLTLIPISGFTFTFKNGANMRNISGDVLLTVNRALTYIWGGSSWHQIS